MLPFTGPAPEPSKFEPINFKKATALTRHGSLPRFDFPSLLDHPELLPVVPQLPGYHSTSHNENTVCFTVYTVNLLLAYYVS